MKIFKLRIFCLLALGLLLQGCSSQPTSTPVLKIALLPIIDAVPIYAAQQEGLFEKHGIKVEIIPVAAAPDRDQLMSAGQADGEINETASVMLFNKDSVQLQIVRYALRPTSSSPHFYILASAKSGITKVDQLKGVEIGVSQGTVIEYVTDRLLEAHGFTANDIKVIPVPKLSDRMTLLASGSLSAGAMPDPLATLAMQQGSVNVLDDSQYPQYGYSVISFRKAVIDANPSAVNAFLAALEEATTQVNQDPARFANILSDQKIVPEPLLASYKLPVYPMKGVPSVDEWNDSMQWMLDNKLLTTKIDYAATVTDQYLP
jgi:NitT/TauT family transport system substrate-binding protein